MLYLRRFNRFVLISLALLGLSVSSANAALINYDEGVSGEITGRPTFVGLPLPSGGPWPRSGFGSTLSFSFIFLVLARY